MRPFTKLLEGKNNLVGAEVGVWEGEHAADLLANLSIKTLYLVDPWKEYQAEHRYIAQVEQNKNYDKTISNVQPFGDKPVIVKKDSESASKEMEDSSLDFVYIDASHTYDNALKDMTCWLSKIKPGGILAGDDYNWPDVEKATITIREANKNLTFGHERADWWFVLPV